MTSTTEKILKTELNETSKIKYKQLKEEFYERLQEITRNPYKNAKLISRHRLALIMKQVQTMKKRIVSGDRLKQQRKGLLDKYDVIESKDGPKLIKARASDLDPVREFIASEDCFDIIYKAHEATNHGGQIRMMKYIGKKYRINKTLIKLFLQICNVCQKRRKKKQEKTRCAYSRNQSKSIHSVKPLHNAKCFVFILDMVCYPDGPFKYVLVMKDLSTGFMHLRPMMKADAMEVAVELIKIFTDFGPAYKIEVYNADFFKDVLGCMTSFYPDYANIYIFKAKQGFENCANLVHYTLNEWTRVNNSKNWTLGCYMTQWILNNSVGETQVKTSFKSVFGMCYPRSLLCMPQEKTCASNNKVVELSNDDSDVDQPNNLVRSVNKTPDTSITSFEQEYLTRTERIKQKRNTLKKSSNSESTSNTTNDNKASNKKVAVNKEPNIQGVSNNPNNTLIDQEIMANVNNIQNENNAGEIVAYSTVVIDSDKVVQGHTAEIKGVTVEISDSEMDVDEGTDTRTCSSCNKRVDEDITCQRCNKPVHSSCSKNLTIQNKLGFACFTCLNQLKEKVAALKEKVRDKKNVSLKKIK